MELELEQFNWGAFGLAWIWGIFNGSFKRIFVSWLAVLLGICLIQIISPFIFLLGYFLAFSPPIILLLYHMYLGMHGNKWAWKSKKWKSLEDFNKTQRKWAIAAVITDIICAVFVFILIFNYIVNYDFEGKARENEFKKTPVYSNSVRFVHIITHNESYNNSTTNAEATEKLLKHIQEYNISKSPVKYELYNKNTIKISYYNNDSGTYEIRTMYSVYKKKTCNIKQKNRYIIGYDIRDKKAVKVLTVYFDNKGKYTTDL